MWYKIEEVEEKYGLSKLSIYALITREPELRKYIKALEGVLQINDEGIEVLLQHTSKKEDSASTLADVVAQSSSGDQTLVMKRDDLEGKSEEIKSDVASDDDLFSDAFNTSSFFDDEPSVSATVNESVMENTVSDEDFFSNIELDGLESQESESFMDSDLMEEIDDIEDDQEEAGIVEESGDSSFADDLIFPEESVEEAMVPPVVEGLAVASAVADSHDDFYSDDESDEITNAFLEGDEDSVAEIVAASEDDFNMEGYVKALKEKMVIQNEQIRALSAYLDVSRKMLVQDEKIVNIIEGMYKR